jgi:hypothetical protein
MTITGQNGKATIPARRNEHGEYHVRFYTPDGKRYAEADYFTDDRMDAIGTARKMVD